jgi:hypothetical protein
MIKWAGRPPIRLLANPYFSRLHRQGYDLHVYESANLEFCETPNLPVSTCVQVPPNSIANIGYMDVGVRERSFLLAEFYLRYASALATRLGRWLPTLEKRRLFASRGALLLDRAGAELLARRRRSDFVFIHLLLPHSPYEVNERCEPYPRSVHPLRMIGSVSDSVAALRRERYGKQVRCTYRLMARFLDRVDQAYGKGQAIVIVHGDHGVRGTPVPPNDGRLDAFRVEDLNAGFSTVLAVRSPATAGVVHAEPVPLQDFFWGLTAAGFTTLPTGAWRHFVYSTATADPDQWTARSLTPAEMIWASVGHP